MPRRVAADYVRPVSSLLPERLKPPPELSELARDEFIRIVMAERADHFWASDLPLLVQYVEACALAARSVRIIAEDHRALLVWKEACKQMISLSARLRICPQSRQPNNPKRPESTSYYDRMRLEGDLDDVDPA